MRIATAIGLLLAVAAAGLIAFVYSGVYDVGATNPHLEITNRLIRTAVEQSVKRRARDVQVPELDDPEKVHNGFRNFQEMCVVCHGAPGAWASEISKGLYPEAPDLAVAAKAWTPAELYVIAKRGIRMSGMPAWGPTHSDEELWAIVAFLQVLPTMPVAEYRGAVEHRGDASEPEQHRH